MNTELIYPILFWLLAGTVAGISGAFMTAKAINDLKEGRFFHLGHSNLSNVVAGILGLAVACVVFQEYYGGLVYLIPLFASWIPVEVLLKNYLVRRYDRARA